MKIISTVKIENFKAIKNKSFNLKNLNILTGLNGIGKSSFIQSLMLLKQRSLNGKFIKLGTFNDVLCSSADDNEIKITLEVQEDDKITSYPWIFREEEHGHNNYKTKTVRDCPEKLPNTALFSNRCQYLSANRISPALAYPVSEDISERDVGVAGEYILDFIEDNASLDVLPELEHPAAVDKDNENKPFKYKRQLESWLEEISPNTKLNITYHKETNLFSLEYQFFHGNSWSKPFKSINVGFGITYTLPVLATILAVQPNDILIIENPEAHLHPKGQSKIGELIAYAASTGTQIFIETHSDHVINGIRIATKEQKINSDQISIFYFERDNEDHIAKIHDVSIDNEGMLEIDASVENFFDQMNIDLEKILN